MNVAEADGELRFEIIDDLGGGFEIDGSADGHGFVNMADRLGAFGGTVEVVSITRVGNHDHGNDSSPSFA